MGYNLNQSMCLEGEGNCQVYAWVNDVHFHKDQGYNFPDDEGYMTITLSFSKSIKNLTLFQNIGVFNLTLRTIINGTNIQDHNVPIVIKRVTNVNEGGLVNETSYYPQYRMYSLEDTVHNIPSLSDRNTTIIGKVSGLKYVGDIANDGWTGSNMYDPEGSVQVRLKIAKNPNASGGESSSGFDSIFPARTPEGENWLEADFNTVCTGDPWFDDHVQCQYQEGYNSLTDGADIGGHPNTDHPSIRYCNNQLQCQDGIGEGWNCFGVTQPVGIGPGGYCDLTYWSRCMGERGCSADCFEDDGTFNLYLCCTEEEIVNETCDACTHERHSYCSGYDLDPHTYMLAPSYQPTYGDINYSECEEWGYPRSCGPTYGDFYTATDSQHQHDWGTFRSMWYWNCVGGNTDCVDSWWERCEYAMNGGDDSWVNSYISPYSIDNFDGSEITSIEFDIVRDPNCVPDNQSRCESDIQRSRLCLDYDHVNDICMEYEDCDGGACEILDWEFIPTSIKVDGLCSPTVWYDTVGKHFTCNGDTIHDGQFDCMDCRNIKKIRGCLDPLALNHNETGAINWCDLSLGGNDFFGCKEPSKNCIGGVTGQSFGWVSSDEFDAGANQCDFDENTTDIIGDGNAYITYESMLNSYNCVNAWTVDDINNDSAFGEAHGCRSINASHSISGAPLGFCLYDIKCDGEICEGLCDDYGFDGCGVCGGDNTSCENVCEVDASWTTMLTGGGWGASDAALNENWNCPMVNSSSPGDYQVKYNFTIPAGINGASVKADTCASNVTTHHTHVALYNSSGGLITNTNTGDASGNDTSCACTNGDVTGYGIEYGDTVDPFNSGEYLVPGDYYIIVTSPYSGTEPVESNCPGVCGDNSDSVCGQHRLRIYAEDLSDMWCNDQTGIPACCGDKIHQCCVEGTPYIDEETNYYSCDDFGGYNMNQACVDDTMGDGNCDNGETGSGAKLTCFEGEWEDCSNENSMGFVAYWDYRPSTADETNECWLDRYHNSGPQIEFTVPQDIITPFRATDVCVEMTARMARENYFTMDMRIRTTNQGWDGGLPQWSYNEYGHNTSAGMRYVFDWNDPYNHTARTVKFRLGAAVNGHGTSGDYCDGYGVCGEPMCAPANITYGAGGNAPDDWLSGNGAKANYAFGTTDDGWLCAQNGPGYVPPVMNLTPGTTYVLDASRICTGHEYHSGGSWTLILEDINVYDCRSWEVECQDGYTPNCDPSFVGDFWASWGSPFMCAPSGFIGDDWYDCVEQQWGVDFSCYPEEGCCNSGLTPDYQCQNGDMVCTPADCPPSGGPCTEDDDCTNTEWCYDKLNQSGFGQYCRAMDTSFPQNTGEMLYFGDADCDNDDHCSGALKCHQVDNFGQTCQDPNNCNPCSDHILMWNEDMDCCYPANYDGSDDDSCCTDLTCPDGSTWVDEYDNSCENWYNINEAMCMFADYNGGTCGMTANDACCICSGGNHPGLPPCGSNSLTITMGNGEERTIDIDACMAAAPECRMADGYNTGSWTPDGACDPQCNIPECGYDGGDCCEVTCVDRYNDCGSLGYDCQDPTVLEGCVDLTCTCNDNGCVPGQPWNDSDGVSWGCTTGYANSPTACEAYGDDYENCGLTANEACCSCGGGVPTDGNLFSDDDICSPVNNYEYTAPNGSTWKCNDSCEGECGLYQPELDSGWCICGNNGAYCGIVGTYNTEPCPSTGDGGDDIMAPPKPE